MILFRQGEVLYVEVAFTDVDESALDVSGAAPQYRLDDGAWQILEMTSAVEKGVGKVFLNG